MWLLILATAWLLILASTTVTLDIHLSYYILKHAEKERLNVLHNHINLYRKIILSPYRIRLFRVSPLLITCCLVWVVDEVKIIAIALQDFVPQNLNET